MPRDGSGTYTLPGGINPVIAGTTIDVAWANPTLTDVATALTDSLSRTGSGGMLVPFLNSDGAINAPGLAWVNQPSMGLYRPNADEMRFVTGGVDQLRTIVDADNPVQVRVESDSTWRTLLNIFNPYTIIGDWTFQGLVTHEGALITDDSTLVRAGFNVPTGVEPTVPVEGDVWKTATQLFSFINGVVTPLGGSNIVGASTGGTNPGNVLKADGSGGWSELTTITFSDAGAISADGAIATRGSLSIGDGADAISINMSSGLISTFGTGGVSGWGWNVDHFFNVDVKLLEKAAAAFDSALYGQIWVRNDNPPIFVYTDDAGLDTPLCERGSFTLDFSLGFSDSNVITFQYVRIGDFVMAWIPSTNLGNSNGTACGSSDSMPTALRPTSVRYSSSGVVDDSAAIVLAQVNIQADGSIDCFAPNAGVPPNYGNFWSNTGVKGPVTGFTISWHISD